MSRLALLLVAAAIAAGCGRSNDGADARDENASVRRPRVQGDRDQYRLAGLIEAARKQDAEAGDGSLERLRQRWLHTRVRWEVGLAPAFCGDSGPCAVLPFDHRRLRSRVPPGWLPQLRLDPEARQELKECCSQVDGQCVFEFEGALERFELGRERATSLSFAEVELGACRSASPDESWVRRSPGAKSTSSTDPHVALSRTGPVEG